MVYHGFLVPDNYVSETPDDTDMNISSIFWGFSLGAALFAAVQAGRQSYHSWKRKHGITTYVALIWGEWTASIIIGALTWCFQREYVGPSFQLFFLISCCWSLQIQLLMQIIINRIAYLMAVPGAARSLKWGVFLVLLLVNISVMVIWTPAHLQLSPRWVHINEIWDRAEKVIFLIIDLSLNIRFMYLVRSRLIKSGLSKYVPLYRLNLVLVCFSMCLDVSLIGLMSLPSGLSYLQFHPVAYLLKLSIEMNMAELTAKIAKSQNLGAIQRLSFVTPAEQKLKVDEESSVHVEISNDGDIERAVAPPGRIQVTVKTAVTRQSVDELEDIESRSSSQQELKKPNMSF
ncbi:hypothetical protein TrVGV298_004927 [Trichoderma virens]|nr:hypothetical protein TrVGV298_004927 [Trichoderma virens]